MIWMDSLCRRCRRWTKMLVLWMYEHRLISMNTARRIISRLRLGDA